MDPERRLRVQAIVQKTENEADKNIKRKQFSKHLANSQLETDKVTDSKIMGAKNKQKIREQFYEERALRIKEDCMFDLKEEEKHQAASHFKYEINTAEAHTGCIPIIDELDKNKQMWDLLILIMAIFNSFAVPLEYVVTELIEQPSYQIIDLIINILFIFDIIIGFRTTYFNAEGMEIRSPKQLAIKYLTGMFLVDFFSSIPYRYAKLILPAAGWEDAHDTRLLLGTCIHGWGNYEAIRKHRGLWADAPPLAVEPRVVRVHVRRRVG